MVVRERKQEVTTAVATKTCVQQVNGTTEVTTTTRCDYERVTLPRSVHGPQHVATELVIAVGRSTKWFVYNLPMNKTGHRHSMRSDRC
ncbi:unnamed protein product [Soboliphyme baturini]|uniref:Uncharacterized protein n=1 Tax=Soboliphyme baturini TaxID=241478 RepID=A0A183IG15_9BILA|nr:unnamed protein product [Soboliphyme baturini]